MAGRATEDSQNRSATEPSVSLVPVGYEVLGRDTNLHLATIFVLIQRPHGAVRACQVLRKCLDPFWRSTVLLAYLDTWSLKEMLLKADNELAMQARVDPVRVKRSERTQVAKIPKYMHQSNGAVEECCAKDREPHENLRVCALQEARLQSRQQEHRSAVACQARGVRAQSICES